MQEKKHSGTATMITLIAEKLNIFGSNRYEEIKEPKTDTKPNKNGFLQSQRYRERTKATEKTWLLAEQATIKRYS